MIKNDWEKEYTSSELCFMYAAHLEKNYHAVYLGYVPTLEDQPIV